MGLIGAGFGLLERAEHVERGLGTAVFVEGGVNGSHFWVLRKLAAKAYIEVRTEENAPRMSARGGGRGR